MPIRPKQSGILVSLASTALILVLLTIEPSLVFGRAQDQSTGLPTRPAPAGLPRRGQPTHTPVASPTKGHIELQITPPLDIWTVVEWQDGQGGWHVVDGWRGYATTAGKVRWQVTAAEFGKGPFRWQVYQYEDGDLWATSDPFYLPKQNGERITVKIEIPAQFYQ